jgi:MFS family permease
MKAVQQIVRTFSQAIRVQFGQFRSFNHSARLFLLATVMFGIVQSGRDLFFNFYILESGFSREFLGLANAAPYMAVLIAGIPIGMLSDRLGQKRTMIIGVAGSCLCRGLQVIVASQMLILATGFLAGALYTLYFISQAPFIMRVSDPKNRTFLFSANFGLIGLSGAIGSLLVGYLPAIFRGWLPASTRDAIVYQAVLLTMVVSGFFALLPLVLIHKPQSTGQVMKKNHSKSAVWEMIREPLVLKVSLPNLIIGIGAALVIPYMNLFFVERFTVSDHHLGLLFSSSHILIAIASLLVPYLAHIMRSKIRAVVFTQGTSIVFLLFIGFSPYLWLAAFSFLLRGALMNMSMPLYDNFVMEQIPEGEQGTVNSVKETMFQIGWTVGPYISGLVQIRYGFTILFVATSVLYTLAIMLIWKFFGRPKAQQRI